MARKEKDFGKLEDIVDAITISMRKNTKKTVKQMANIVKKEAVKNSSIVDIHTPAWLRQHGHPYKEKNIHSTPIVHKVSGNLSENVEIFKGDRKDELKVGVDENKVSYIDYIINGTPGGQMIARDFLAFSLLKSQKALRKKVIKNFKKIMRSKKITKK